VPLHSGLAARAGFEAVQMARAGFQASASLLEGAGGPGLLTFLRGSGPAIRALAPESWQGDTLDQVYLKPFPGCRHVHPAVEAALGLRQRCSIQSALRASIDISTYGLAASFGAMPRPRAELYDCLMSLPWCVALALLRGRPTADAVSIERADADLWSLATRINIRTDDAHEAAYPERLGATITIRRRDGTVIQGSAVLRYASAGASYSPEGPFGPVLNEQGCIDKFVTLTSRVLAPNEQNALVNAILSASPSSVTS
jgi:2-methylcitrate dehydratase PrpD